MHRDKALKMFKWVIAIAGSINAKYAMNAEGNAKMVVVKKPLRILRASFAAFAVSIIL
jgi:hypothetical protein